MSEYFRTILTIITIGAVFGYIFAPQIHRVKHAFLAWKARRARRRRGGVRR